MVAITEQRGAPMVKAKRPVPTTEFPLLSRFRCPAVLIIAALPLVSCATPPERQRQKMSVASEQLWAQYDACMTQVERTAVYQRLDQAYILRRDDPQSIEKMAIDRRANDQEKADLLANKKNTDRCNQVLFKGFAEINPGFNVLLARFMSEDDELVLQTVQENVTVGARNLTVHQRFAKRLRDWNFAGERIIRLYTWRLRRTCTIYCSSFSASSLLPTSTQGISNLAGATPPPPAGGQAAGLQQFKTTAEPPTQAASTAATPAAQEPTVAATPAAPAALEVETTAQAAPPPEPVTAAALAAQEAETTAEPQAQAAATAAKPAALEPAVAAAPAALEAETIAHPAPPKPAPPKPVTAAAPAAQGPETTAESPPQQAETTAAPAAPAVQKTETAAQSPARKPATAAAPAAREAETTAKPATQTTGSALKPPTQDVDTGLKPAAGPADEPAKPKKQQVQVAFTPETAQPQYTVHLASMRSEVEARAEWGQLQARYPAILGDRVLFTREVEIRGQGTYVRVLTGLFHDRGQAIGLCGQLGGGEQYCKVMRL